MKLKRKSENTGCPSRRTVKRRVPFYLGIAASAVMLAGTLGTSAMEVHMDKGIIFFAPETDLSYTEEVMGSTLVNGAEIFVSWAQVEPQEGQYDWSSIEKYADDFSKAGKKLSFRISTASFSPNDSPKWLFEDYNVRRVTNGYWLSFEGDLKGYEVLDGARLTSQAEQVISGSKSLYGTGKLISSGSNNLLSMDGFNIGFDFKAFSATALQVAAIDGDGNTRVLKEWALAQGESGARNFYIEIKQLVNNEKIAILSSGGEMSLDNINISVNKAGFHVGNLAFPYYLDPMFEEKWTNLVKAMAAKFKNDSRIAGISVGGYGRWEEVTLSGDSGVAITTDMWQQLGFTQDKYVAHLKKMIDLFNNELTPAGIPVYMCAIGFPTAGLADQTYIDWKVTNYLAKKGIAIKYNGWQSMASEWGGESNAVFTQINRFKHQDLPVIFEQGGQINSTLGEVMGHPLSMYNRVIIDNVDYYWNYFKDMVTPFTAKYMQYASESAGSALITKMYNIPGKTVFRSPVDNNTYNLYNQWMGLFQTNKSASPGQGGVYRIVPYGEYGTAGGSAIATGNVRYSIDDRQKYNGMYGGTVNIEYFDDNQEEFTIYGIAEGNKQSPLAVVRKSGSGTWKTLSMPDTGFMKSSKNSGREILTEINTKGDIKLKLITVDYVPARDWKMSVVSEKLPADKTGIDLSGKQDLSVPYDLQKGVSGISIFLTPDGEGYINVKAVASAVTASGKILLAQKEYFMPEDQDEFYIPLADAPAGTQSFEIEISATRGKAFAAASSDGGIAYKAYAYSPQTRPASPLAAKGLNVELAAGAPFYGLYLNGEGKVEGTISKVLTDDRVAKDIAVFSADLSKDGQGVYFEPQTAGRYIVRFTAASEISSVSALYLDRIEEANPPMRYGFGSSVVVGSGSSWQGIRDLAALSKESDGSVRWMATGVDAALERTGTVSFEAKASQTIHLVIKNGTSSGYGKFYWKTAEENEYTEEKSVVIPLLANDTEFREFSWPLGGEPEWTGTITGMKFLPAGGLTDFGYLSIKRFEIHADNQQTTGYREALDLKDIEESSFVQSDKLYAPLFPAIGILENMPEQVSKETIEILPSWQTRPVPAVNPDAGKAIGAADGKTGSVLKYILYAVLALALGSLAFGAALNFGRTKSGSETKK